MSATSPGTRIFGVKDEMTGLPPGHYVMWYHEPPVTPELEEFAWSVDWRRQHNAQLVMQPVAERSVDAVKDSEYFGKAKWFRFVDIVPGHDQPENISQTYHVRDGKESIVLDLEQVSRRRRALTRNDPDGSSAQFFQGLEKKMKAEKIPNVLMYPGILREHDDTYFVNPETDVVLRSTKNPVPIFGEGRARS